MGISLTAPAVTRTLSIERTNLAAGWSFDLAALERACAHLQIYRPVVFGLRRRLKWGGIHVLRDGEHRVGVQAHVSPERASRTLWHELAHCAQYDHGQRPNTMAVFRAQGRDAYMNHPAEVEARAAEANAEWLCLVRA